ncbi:Probable Ras GTPase-activating protein [Eumeta japonica]|uniref:Probable Ras GTPase-activating protein n=1 Tax=Eumeta variegata TaxID=151549 RepID=A0A4C1TMY9_EUMVA|nr:Probable Ras GTPase-activating protein [Eumeta japonica]
MEAFLKLTGEQYLQDTLAGPINEIIQSDRDCEVDPTKATGSLQRQQASLRCSTQCLAVYLRVKQTFSTTIAQLFCHLSRDWSSWVARIWPIFNISFHILRFLCPAILSPSLLT